MTTINPENQQNKSLITEQINEAKLLLEKRIDDYNYIFTKFHSRNDEIVQNINTRLDAIASSSLELAYKKKFLSKINKYLAIILIEHEELKIKPKKTRFKDLERLSNYFDTIDKVVTKVETKLNNKAAAISEAELSKIEKNLDNLSNA